jgi:hypothetical protein
MPDPETIALRATVIGGKTYADDFTVIWRTLPIGRIMLAPGLPPHVQQWRWTCNFYGKPGGGGGGSGDDLDDCKQFKEAGAGLTDENFASKNAARSGAALSPGKSI